MLPPLNFLVIGSGWVLGGWGSGAVLGGCRGIEHWGTTFSSTAQAWNVRVKFYIKNLKIIKYISLRYPSNLKEVETSPVDPN